MRDDEVPVTAHSTLGSLIRPLRPLRVLCPCALAALLLGACHDADGDPTAILMPEQSRSALMLRTELPSLPNLVSQARTEDRSGGAVEAWIGSWETATPDEGRAMRERAYGEVAGLLADELGAEGARSASRTLGEALATVDAVPSDGFPPEVLDRIDEARRLDARAGRALASDRVAEAFALTLEGADALREVGPEGVARTLILRAEEALASARGAQETQDAQDAQEAREPQVREGAALAPEDLDRSERLVRGARLALEDDDWRRALRRAYYACQILGVSPD